MNESRDGVPSASGPRRVLVVDEGGEIARALADTLSAAQYQVTVAESEAAAQAALAHLLSDAAGATETGATKGLSVIVTGKGRNPSVVCITASAFPSAAAFLTAMRVAGTAPAPGPWGDVLKAVDLSFEYFQLRAERAVAQAALNESEKVLRGILDNATAVIYAKDRDGRYLFVNKKFESIFGFDTERLKGKSDHDIFPAEMANAFRRHDLDVLHTGQPLEIEETALHADGPHEYVSIKFPLFDAQGAIRGVCGMSTDITDRKRAEEQLRHAQRMEAVGHLSGGIAHDFNNLHAVILGNLELIEEQIEAGSMPHLLATRAIEAARRAALLTERLLAYSRKQVLQPQATDVNALVLKTVDLVSRSLGETIQVRTVLAGDAKPAYVDPGRLEDALLNLAVNSRDAMPKGGILTIKTLNLYLDEFNSIREGVETGEYVLVSVADTGTGMAPEVRDRAFEPFFTTKEVGKGTGLGLSMVYGFVAQSGGQVTIESEAGKGTTVRLLLPRAPDDAPRATGTIVMPQERLLTGIETILVVEDDAEVRRIAVSMLEDLGYQVLQAADAAAALAVTAAAAKIDLLLTDAVLPQGLSGRELAETIRARRPGTKVLYMSGYGGGPDGLIEEGARVLSKPFRKSDLALTVRSILDTPSYSGKPGA